MLKFSLYYMCQFLSIIFGVVIATRLIMDQDLTLSQQLVTAAFIVLVWVLGFVSGRESKQKMTIEGGI